MSSLRGTDISSSTVHGVLTWPEMLNSLVPEFLSLPKPANQVPPRRQISGATATVSTLETVVGHPNTPRGRRKDGCHYQRASVVEWVVFVFYFCFFWPSKIQESSQPTYVCRKGRLESGFPLLALQGLDEGRLLSADVGSCSPHHKHIKVVARAAGVLPNQPGSVCLVNSHLLGVRNKRRDKTCATSKKKKGKRQK